MIFLQYGQVKPPAPFGIIILVGAIAVITLEMVEFTGSVLVTLCSITLEISSISGAAILYSVSIVLVAFLHRGMSEIEAIDPG